MKKRFLAFALILSILCSVSPLPALAETPDSSQSTEVIFEITENDVTPPVIPDDGNSGGSGDSGSTPTESYIVNIPSSINLNYEHDIVFTANYVDISDNQRLIVSIDGSRTFPDGNFYLYTGDGADDSKRIKCSLLRGSSSDFSVPPSEELTGPNDAVVATFKNGKAGADTYGWLKFGPSYSLKNVVGTYTGTIYFNISVINDDV